MRAGSNQGTQPALANPPRVKVTKAQSVPWSNRPPPLDAAPKRRARMPSKTSVTMASAHSSNAASHCSPAVNHPAAGAAAKRAPVRTFAQFTAPKSSEWD